MEKHTIRHVKTEAMNIVSVRDRISLSQISTLMGMTLSKITKYGLTMSDDPFTKYYDDDYDESCMDVEYCLPVVDSREGITECMKPMDCIMTRHKGPYSELGYAYAALYNYIKLKGLIQDGPLFERYPCCEKDNQVIEIYIPVKTT